jgi:hypothetical protein
MLRRLKSVGLAHFIAVDFNRRKTKDNPWLEFHRNDAFIC